MGPSYAQHTGLRERLLPPHDSERTYCGGPLTDREFGVPSSGRGERHSGRVAELLGGRIEPERRETIREGRS